MANDGIGVRALKGLIETLEKAAVLEAFAKELGSEETRKKVLEEIKAEYPEGRAHDLLYVRLFCNARHKLEDLGRSATFAVRHVSEILEDVALLDRLQTVMESLEVYANIDRGYGSRPSQDNTRELRLLELLFKDDKYEYEARKLREAIAKTLNEVEEQEWETEQENAISALETAGFVRVEDDFLDGWRRMPDGQVVEEVVIEINTSRRHGIKEFGYKFSYERKDGTTVMALVDGKSGEFGKLLEAIAVPTAA